jgi:hypothetical protein
MPGRLSVWVSRCSMRFFAQVDVRARSRAVGLVRRA